MGSKQKKHLEGYKHVLASAGRYIRYFYMAMILLPVISLFSALQPYISKLAIDKYIVSKDESGLLRIMVLYLFLVLSEYLFKFLCGLATAYFSEKVMHDLRKKIFDKFQALSIDYHNRNKSGSQLTRISGDINNLKDFFENVVINIGGDFLTIIFVLFFLFSIDVKLALVLLPLLAILSILTAVFSRIMSHYLNLARDKQSEMNSIISETIEGIREIQLFKAIRRQWDWFSEVNTSYTESYLLARKFEMVLWGGVGFFYRFFLAVILWYGGGRVLQETLTLGTMVAFMEYIERLFRPIDEIVHRTGIIQAAMVSIGRIEELLKQDDVEQAIVEDRMGSEVKTWDIEFEDVSFYYNDAEPVLEHVSFRISEGEKIAFIGTTGSGKTTLFKLLTGFYRPQSGRILIGGKDISQYSIHDLRRQFALITQDIYIFNDSIKQNITLGRVELPDEQITSMINNLAGPEFLLKFSDGIHFELKEKGADLSFGQRQMLSFMRIAVLNPPIILLDEATSSVDVETEKKLHAKFMEVSKKHTSIIIAHRYSTIRDVDRIFKVMDCGVAEVSRDNVFC